MKLFHKLIAAFLFVALMGWTTGYFAVERSRQALQKAFVDRAKATAREILDGIEDEVWDKVEIFHSYARDLTLQDEAIRSNQKFEGIDDIDAYMEQRNRAWVSASENEITPFMKGLMDNRLARELIEKQRYYELQQGTGVFGEIFVTNRFGANIAMTGRTTDYRQEDERWWQMAKKKGLFISDVNFDESSDVYSIDLAIRVDDDKGNFIGALKAVLGIDGMVGFIRTVEDSLIKKGHETIVIKIIDRHGRMIYSTNDFRFLEDASYLIPAGHFDPEFGSSEVFTEERQKGDGSGREIFVSHIHSQGVAGLNWILLIEQDMDELFAPVRELEIRVLTLSMFFTVISLLIGYFIARSIANNIQGLKEAAAKIGRGELETNIDVRTTDEIGQLAGSLKQMADDLRTTTVARDDLVSEVRGHRRTEEELRKFKFISENSNDAHFLIGRDARFMYVNKAACRMLGYSEEELLELGVPDVDAVCDLGKYQELFDLIQEKSVPTVETVNKRKDGSLFASEITVTGYSIDGRPHMFAALRDITERKGYEEEIRKFKTIADSANYGIAIADLSGRLEYVNDNFAAVHGYSPEELIGKSLEVFHSKEQLKRVYGTLEKIKTEGGFEPQEIWHSHRDGRAFPMLMSGVLIKDENDEPVYMAASAIDITGLKQAQKALQDSEEKYRSLVMNIPDIVWTTDMHGRTTFISPNVEQVYGYTPEEIYRQGDALWFGRIHPHDVDKVKQEFRALFEQGRGLNVEYRIQRKDGKWIWLLDKSIGTYEKDGVKQADGVFIDITKRKQSEEALAKARDEIDRWSKELEKRVKEKSEELKMSQSRLIQAEKLSAVGRVAAGLAHEFNSPLAGLLPLLQKYKKTAKQDSEAFHDLALMLEAAKYMASIVRDFGSFARKPSEERSSLDLNDVVESTLSFSSGQMDKQGIQLTREFGNGLPAVNGNKTELQQVILNILANAMDAMPDGGKFIVKTGASADKKEAVIEFIDSGIGISGENMARVFDPFFTTKKPGKGVGLGLSISYGIIKNHGGNIEVESKLGKGARFRVSLPALTKGAFDDA